MLKGCAEFLMGVSKKRIKELFSRNVTDQERRKQASQISQIYLLLSVVAEGLINEYYQFAS